MSSKNTDALIERTKKEKEDSDDTTSFEDNTEALDDFEVSAKQARRDRRRGYKSFIKENKSFWMWFNFTVAFFSAGFMVGTYLVLEDNTSDCANLSFTLYAVVCLHGINILMSLVNLCGLETKICNQNAVCCYVLFEMTILVFMQVSYFSAQYSNCITSTGAAFYWWTMGQILAVYIGLAVVICHFFRKFCQDPQLEEEQEK